MVIVSRETNRDSVITAMITSSPQGAAADILPLAGLDCERFVRGWVRGDLIANLPKVDPYWGAFMGRMSNEDLAQVRKSVCAAVNVNVN